MDNKRKTQDKLTFTGALKQNVIYSHNYLITVVCLHTTTYSRKACIKNKHQCSLEEKREIKDSIKRK